jgi:hypothetical protein
MCPSDCLDKDHISTPATIRGKGVQVTRASGSNKSEQLKREPKKEIKKEEGGRLGDSLCEYCNPEKYLDGLLHADDCSEYLWLKDRKAWAITRERNLATWETLSEQDKQRAHLEDIFEMKRRNSQKQKQMQDQEADFELTFNQSLMARQDSNELTEDWKAWLRGLHTPETFTGIIGHYPYLRALHYSRQGYPIPSPQELAGNSRINPYPEIIAPGCEHV